MRNLFYTIFFVALFLFFLHPVGGDGDYYHHLNAGKDIVMHHTLPHKDTYTFTATGKEWVDHSWLSGVIFYLIDNSFGPYGVSVFVSAVAVVTLILLSLLLKTYKLKDYTVFTVTAIVAAALSTRWPSRPEIFTYPFVISLLLVDRLQMKRPNVRYLFPLIILLWANVYGASVIFGDLLLLLFMLKHRKFDAVTFFSIPLSLLNGYGFKTLFYLYNIREISQTQMEWFGVFKILSDAPYGYLLTVQYYILIFICYFLFTIFLVAAYYKKLRSHLFESLLMFSIIAPIVALRQFGLTAVLAAPGMGLLFSQIKNASAKKAALIIPLFFIAVSLYVNPPNFAPPDQYPDSLVSFIKNYDLRGNAINHPQDGGFISYYFYPKIKIFADTRDELFLGTTIAEDYYQAIAEKSVPQLLAKYHANIIIGDLSEGDAYKEFFYSNDWKPVYIGGRYFVAVPKAVASEKHMPVLDSVDPFSPSFAKSGKEKEAIQLYAQFAKRDTDSVDSKLRYAYALAALKRYDDAITVLKNIHASQTPGNVLFNMSNTYLTAQIYLNKGDCSNAKKYLDNTNQGVKSIMLFTPWNEIPSPVDQGYEMYNGKC